MQQVQALVAEHKLGASGRKLGAAMTKELINTPGRLAYVNPAASVTWAAIKQRKQKARSARQSIEAQRAASIAASEASSMGRTASQELLEQSLDGRLTDQLPDGYAEAAGLAASRQASNLNDLTDPADVCSLPDTPTSCYAMPALFRLLAALVRSRQGLVDRDLWHLYSFLT